jgi:hypothetical protein
LKLYWANKRAVLLTECFQRGTEIGRNNMEPRASANEQRGFAQCDLTPAYDDTAFPFNIKKRRQPFH